MGGGAVALAGAGPGLPVPGPGAGGGPREGPMSSRAPGRDRLRPRVVPGLGLGRGPAAEAVHEPAGVVPVHPGAGYFLQVAQGPDRAVPERRPRPDAFGLVQPDGRLRQGVVIGIPDGPDRTGQPGQHEGLGEPDRGVLGELKGSSQRRALLASVYGPLGGSVEAPPWAGFQCAGLLVVAGFSFLGCVAGDQALAVVAAEQEDEAVQVVAQLLAP